jgi:anhydro-N-acetylmuramic acid kinase
MNTTYQVIGLMSGTSLDGLDIAYCIFEKLNDKWYFKIKEACCIKYSNKWVHKLSTADQLTAFELLNLHNEYGYFLGKECRKFIDKHQIQVDFIASHGHTVFHQPAKKITFQIGSGECIAAACGCNVINDFRAMDVAMGGQGAPLVPIGDQLLFDEYEFCINLGGFANISYQSNNQRIAYDVCPVNIVLNPLAIELGFSYDDKGMLAAQGFVHTGMLSELENIEYYKRCFPKSLGKEWLIKEFSPVISRYELNVYDKLRTLSEHIVSQVLKATKTHKAAKLLFTGGGTYNDFIISQIRVKSNHTVIIPDSNIIDFKEAMIFAFLGVLRKRGEVNCLKSVTGALSDNIGGKVIIV